MRSGLSTCGRHRHNLVVASVVPVTLAGAWSLPLLCVICVSAHHVSLHYCWLSVGYGHMGPLIGPALAPLPTAEWLKSRHSAVV